MAVTDQDITSSLSRPCKVNQGGLQTVYIFPYIKYSRSQISLIDELITSYPIRQVFEYEATGMSFNENAKISNGGVEWSQSLSFKIPVIDRTTEVDKLNYKDYCVIFRDRQNVLRLMGLWNGATIETTSESGASKSSFSGYSVTVQAKEAMQAAYLTEFTFNTKFIIQ